MPSRHGSRPDKAGYSLVELLVALAITLSIAGSTLTVVSGLRVRFGVEGEQVDRQQRIRLAVSALARDLSGAGIGFTDGPGVEASASTVAAVVPFRQGAVRPDLPGTFKSDVVTIHEAPARTAARTTLSQPMRAQSGTAFIGLDPGCPPTDPACGFSAGMDVLIVDDTGAYDTFRVLTAQPGALGLQHTMADTAQIYSAGARILEATSRTYSLKAEPATDTFQLMRYDGVASDVAVVDHVIGLALEYFGEPSPPMLLGSGDEPAGSWTTYGPRPPPPGVQSAAYRAGENCVFQLDAARGHVLPRLGTLGDGTGTALVKLTQEQLRDGPWCPDNVNVHRYDADLLRIRRVSVTLRVESALSAFRGPAGVLFLRGGTARDASRWVPDQEVRFDIAPRNLNVGR